MSAIFGFMHDAIDLLMAGVMIWTLYESYREKDRDRRIEMLLRAILIGCIGILLK